MYTIKPTHATPHVTLGVVLLVTGVCALTLRLVFVGTVLAHHTPDQIRSICSDTAGYLHLADNLVSHGRYAGPSMASRHMAMLRPPGYPLFCAAFEWVGLSTTGVLVAQAFIGACIPVAVALLVYGMLRSKAATLLAGLASALSPTGIGITGVVLSDVLFAALLLVGLVLLYLGVSRARPHVSWSAGAVFGMAGLVKPILLFWPLVSPILWWCFAQAAGRTTRRQHVLAFVAVQAAFLGAWCIRNYVTEGQFALSTIGQQSLRHYMVPRIEEWNNAGGPPGARAIIANRAAQMNRDRADLAAGMSPAALTKRHAAESFAACRANPWITLQIYYANIKENLREGWSYFAAQLPAGSRRLAALGIARRITMAAQQPALILFALALLELVSRPRRLRDARWRRGCFSSLALALTIAYFGMLSGLSYWQGSRIMYPCESAQIALGTCAVASLLDRGRLVLRPYLAARPQIAA